MSLFRRIKIIWSALCQPGTLQVLYQGVALAPRLIVHLASVAALAGLFVACVPAAQYEEAKSASEVELASRQRAEAELAATRAKLDAANAELGERDVKLAATEESVSETKLENSVARKERDEATGLVDQLRGELGRVGDDLRSYAQQKAELERSLAAAEAKKQDLERSEAHTVAIARLTRDLTSALGDRVLSGDITIDVVESKVALSAPSELWFGDGPALVPGADAALAAIAHVLALHADSSVRVAPVGVAELGEERARALKAALGTHGIDAARITALPAETPTLEDPSRAIAPVAKTARVQLSFSVN